MRQSTKVSAPAHVAVPDESTTGRHIPALDGLRGVAILLVLAHHLLSSNPNAQGSLLVRAVARLHGAGWVGVDLFFVLSGFLITGILYDTLDDRHFFRNFYARRTLRIFPLYYGFMALLLIITLFTHDRWYPGLWTVLTYTENLRPGGILVSYAWWININHVWSLAIEEQFYIVWPLLVFLLRTRRRIAVAAICGIAFSVLVRFSWVHFTDMTLHPSVVYSWTPARLDGLLSGSLLAVLTRTSLRARLLRAGPLVLAAGAATLAPIWITQGDFEWAGKPLISVVLPLLLALTFSGLLLCCLRPRSHMRRAFANPVLRFFGRYSYGLYLFHYTLNNCITFPLRNSMHARGDSKLLAVLLPAAVTLAVSVAAAWLSFHYFELPFLRLKDRFTNRSPHPRLRELATAPIDDTSVIAAE